MGRFFAGFLLSFAAGTLPLTAQGIAGGFVVGSVGGGSQTNNPISLVTERKTVQTLADGTHITNTTREILYRDSLGRTRSESYVATPPAFSGGEVPHMVTVMDPVAGTHMTWLTGGDRAPKTYSQLAVPSMNSGAMPRPTGQMSVTPAIQRSVVPRQANRPDIQSKHEFLGTQDIQGILCEASRDTAVYPEGSLNNDKPITVVDETCYSREMERVIQEMADDPRFGITTVTIQSVSRSEPDASLFQPPPDYTAPARAVGGSDAGGR